METLTALEDQLAQDAMGQVRNRLITQLEAAINELGQQQRLPAEPAYQASLERKRQSCLAAIRIIETIWSYQHESVLFQQR